MTDIKGGNRRVMSASTLDGDKVVNNKGENLGKIEDIMLDLENGQVAYVVLSFGGIMGIGDKLFALPWDKLTVDLDNKRFVLNVDKELLDKAPGFDKDQWPDNKLDWIEGVYNYYGSKPYWNQAL